MVQQTALANPLWETLSRMEAITLAWCRSLWEGSSHTSWLPRLPASPCVCGLPMSEAHAGHEAAADHYSVLTGQGRRPYLEDAHGEGARRLGHPDHRGPRLQALPPRHCSGPCGGWGGHQKVTSKWPVLVLSLRGRLRNSGPGRSSTMSLLVVFSFCFPMGTNLPEREGTFVILVDHQSCSFNVCKYWN